MATSNRRAGSNGLLLPLNEDFGDALFEILRIAQNEGHERPARSLVSSGGWPRVLQRTSYTCRLPIKPVLPIETEDRESRLFSPPSVGLGQGYSCNHNACTTLWTLSLFAGNYLMPNSVYKSFMDIKFSQQITSVTLDFATADFQQGEIPSPLQVTAYENSTGAPTIGSATAQGTYASDTMPMGMLSFNSGGTPFNLVELECNDVS